MACVEMAPMGSLEKKGKGKKRTLAEASKKRQEDPPLKLTAKMVSKHIM